MSTYLLFPCTHETQDIRVQPRLVCKARSDAARTFSVIASRRVYTSKNTYQISSACVPMLFYLKARICAK